MSLLLEEYKLRQYGHTISEIKELNFFEKRARLMVIEAIEINQDISEKTRMLYAIDYNKELMNQLEEKSKSYDEVLGITIERNEQLFWEEIYRERQRFIDFVGRKKLGN